MALNIGKVLNNRYRIVKLLNQGGFGAVYRVWDINMECPRALKENLETSADGQKQFKLEARILSLLSHPNLPHVIDHFIIQGQGQYLVMDFVEGQDLQEMLDRQGRPLSESLVMPWIEQVCDALDYLHRQSPPIIHRDIKPANIKIRPDGKAMLVDFGIAKVFNPNLRTTIGARAITPGYSPIEQHGAGTTDARSDIYALGATLYTLLTAKEPPESVQRVISDHLVAPERANPAITSATARIIQKAMQIYPAQRYQSAADFKADLSKYPIAVSESHLAQVSSSKSVAKSVLGFLQRSTASSRSPWFAAGAILLIIFIGVIIGWFNPWLPKPTPSETETNTSTVWHVSPLYFTSNRDENNEIYRLKDKQVERLTFTSNKGESWDPFVITSGTMYFTSDRDGKREIYRLKEKQVERLTFTPDISESWDPYVFSSGAMYFTSDRDGKREIYRLKDKQVEQLTFTPNKGESWDPFVTISGTMYFTSDRDGKREIYWLKDKQVEQLTVTPNKGESWDPFISSSGMLYFTSDRDGKPEIYRLQDNKIERLTFTPGNGESWGGNIR